MEEAGGWSCKGVEVKHRGTEYRERKRVGCELVTEVRKEW